MQTLRVIRLVAWGLVGVCLFVAVALGLGYWRTGGVASLTEPVATIGGPFTLVDTKGQTVTEKAFLGKPTVYFFGFTHCPDVCPTTLMEMTSLLAALGSDADRFNVVFVSVDPARDSPQAMADYLSAFDPRIVGLTGTIEQVDAITKAFRVYVKRGEPDPKTGDYSVDHMAAVYVMNAKGQFIVPIQYGEEEATALAKMRRGLEG